MWKLRCAPVSWPRCLAPQLSATVARQLILIGCGCDCRVAASVETKMGTSNLARVFGPTAVGYSCPEPEPMQMINETRKQAMVCQLSYLCTYTDRNPSHSLWEMNKFLFIVADRLKIVSLYRSEEKKCLKKYAHYIKQS